MSITPDVLQTFDDVRTRLFGRLDGLTDEEYLWEPVGGCLSVRDADEGQFKADLRPSADIMPAPFTTIAWRMWHIGSDCLRAYGRFFEGGAYRGDKHVWPGTATEGIGVLADDWKTFIGRVEALGDERLLEPMGEIAAPYAHESYLLLALHALDEVAHHGAEVGVIRDLYLRR